MRGRFAAVMGMAAMLAAPGCAQPKLYRTTEFKLGSGGKGRVAVGVQDRRENVLDGSWQPTVVGFQRGNFSPKVDNYTGAPLADDMGISVQNALRQAGYESSAVALEPEDKEAKAVSKLKEGGADRLLLLTLRQWKSEFVGPVTMLFYDVQARVLDRQGKELFSGSFTDVDGKSQIQRSHDIQGDIKLYKKIFGEILNSEALQKALR